MSPAEAGFGQRDLRKRDEGEDVRWLQGFLDISVDGDFGTKTDAAVRAWQKAHRLSVDGVVGDFTSAAMVATFDAAQVALAPAPAAPITTPSRPVEDGVITLDIIRIGFPKAKDPERWGLALTAAWQRFPQFNRKGVATILAKADTEAMNLTRWDEDLYYTTVEQLVRMHGARAGNDPASLLRRPVATGDQVYQAWGGYPGRGLGLVQLTTLANHQAFARDMGMPLPDAREWMLTPEGAAMTPFWYLAKNGATAAANRGDMKEVMRVVAGKRDMAGLDAIWDRIHGNEQMADYRTFAELLHA